jgi:protein-tyrosine-phosphatase
MNVLFVCSGNVSRSFLAEALFRSELKALKVEDISVSSAGLYAFPGNPPDPQMTAYLSSMGVSFEPHEARQISKQELDWADLILVMERRQEADLEKLWPEAKLKVQLLGKYVAGGWEDEILDPFGKSPYHYRLAQSQITLAVQSLAKWLVQNKNPKKALH